VNRDVRHRSLLTLIRRIIDVPLAYSKNDLIELRSAASMQYPAIVPLIDEYIRLAELSDTDVILSTANERQIRKRRASAQEMHLFDLLRERKLFPTNADLAEFAVRVIPEIPKSRFLKISRAEIAARIIDYLETLNPQTREKLEASMRDAVAVAPRQKADRQSFFSKWERIIKGA
jgi:hypothetical protein